MTDDVVEVAERGEVKPLEFSVGERSPYAFAVNGESVTVFTDVAIRALNEHGSVNDTVEALTTAVVKIVTQEPRAIELAADDVDRISAVIGELVAKVSG